MIKLKKKTKKNHSLPHNVDFIVWFNYLIMGLIMLEEHLDVGFVLDFIRNRLDFLFYKWFKIKGLN